MENAYLNLTYKSPHEDFENCAGWNTDGSINIKYTLATMKDLLIHNAEIIDKLLKNADSINHINAVGYCLIDVIAKSNTALESLINENILSKKPPIDIEEANIDELQLSDEETNQTRFNSVNNLIIQNNTGLNTNHSSEESDVESDEIIFDEQNTASILNKYKRFIQTNDNESDSNDE